MTGIILTWVRAAAEVGIAVGIIAIYFEIRRHRVGLSHQLNDLLASSALSVVDQITELFATVGGFQGQVNSLLEDFETKTREAKRAYNNARSAEERTKKRLGAHSSDQVDDDEGSQSDEEAAFLRRLQEEEAGAGEVGDEPVMPLTSMDDAIADLRARGRSRGRR